MMQPTVLAKAPGKLVLMGEYAVLEGGNAWVMAVPRYAKVRWAISPDGHNKLSLLGFDSTKTSWQWPSDDSSQTLQIPEAPYVGQLLRQACRLWQQHNEGRLPPALSIVCDTKELYVEHLENKASRKLGLGSSAALSVSFFAAFAAFCQTYQQPSKIDVVFSTEMLAELWQRAFWGHRQGHAPQGSGIDVAASLCGGMLEYKRSPGFSLPVMKALPMHTELFLLMIDTGYSAQTEQLVAQVQDLKTQNPKTYWRLMEHLVALSQGAIDFWQLSYYQALFSAIEGAYDVLSELGEASGANIVTAEHQALSKAAKACQTAYKPSGAGGGDMGIAFCPSLAARKQLQQHVADLGFQSFPLSEAAQGISLEETIIG